MESLYGRSYGRFWTFLPHCICVIKETWFIGWRLKFFRDLPTLNLTRRIFHYIHGIFLKASSLKIVRAPNCTTVPSFLFLGKSDQFFSNVSNIIRINSLIDVIRFSVTTELKADILTDRCFSFSLWQQILYRLCQSALLTPSPIK